MTVSSRTDDAESSTIRLQPIGFWSYSRQDDELSKGKLSNLRALLMSEIQQQYGREPIQLFQDVSAIPHGAEWGYEIRKSLYNATFFIPIITPNFIQSEWCSAEVMIFLEREQDLCATYPELPRRSRIFPLQLIDITGVDAFNPDVLAALELRQSFDFRALRHRNLDDETVRHALADFATSIRRALQIKVRPPLTPEERERQATEAAAAQARQEALRREEEAARAKSEAARLEAEREAEARSAEAARLEAQREADRIAETERQQQEQAAAATARLGALQQAGEGWELSRHGKSWAAAGLVAALLGAGALYVSANSGESADRNATENAALSESSVDRPVAAGGTANDAAVAANPGESGNVQSAASRVAPPTAETNPPTRTSEDLAEACSRRYRQAGTGTPAQQLRNLRGYLQQCPAEDQSSDARQRIAEISAYRDAIDRVRRADIRAGSSGSVPAIWAAIRAIDLSGTPDDFRRAYRRHVSAWSERAEVEREPEGAAKQARRAEADQRVWSTYNAAVAIAARYGVSRR